MGRSQLIQVAVDFGLSEVMTKRNVPTEPTFMSLDEILDLAPGLKSRCCWWWW